jgi:hypothetical protein
VHKNHVGTVTEEVLCYLLADVIDLNESSHESCDILQNRTCGNMVILQFQ